MSNAKINPEISRAIKANVALSSYVGTGKLIGQYISTCFGEFICQYEPNPFETSRDLYFLFEQVTDRDGEPFTDGPVYKVPA